MSSQYVQLPQSGGGSGVSSLNSLTGALTLVAGTGISVTPSGSNITIATTGGGGVTTIGTIDSEGSPSANGASISSTNLIMQSASGTVPGLINTTTQTFAGVKTFSSAPNLSSLTASTVLVLDGSKNVSSSPNIAQGTIGITIDGGGTTPTTGVKGFIYIPYACTINSVTLMADQSGSCVVDLWVTSYSSFPPTVANTITASDLPTLSSQQNHQDTTLTGWTTSISAGSVMAFNLNSASTLTRINLVLKVTKI